MFVRSVDYSQISGLNKVENLEECLNQHGSIIVPCGKIAETIFNDTFELYRIKPNKSKGKLISIIRKNMTWKQAFHNPTTSNCDTLECNFYGNVKPISWKKNIWELDADDQNNNGFQNEPFIVWMRPAAFSTFRKIYGVLSRKNDNIVQMELLPASYMMRIEYSLVF